MTKVAVVGLGSMGQHHARLYSELDCEFVGAADTDAVRGRDICARYKVPYYADYHDLLDRVEAVSIVVPTTLHHHVALDFLNRGVHCLVEKPIAFNLDEAQEMTAAASQHNAVLAVGHIEHFNPAVRLLKQIIDAGDLGRLISIATRRVGPYVPRIRDVGIVIDSASHDIGIVRYLVGQEPLSVFSRVGRLKHCKEDHAVIVLDFGSTTASIEVNWFNPQKVRTLVATGSEATAYLDYIEQTITIRNSHETRVADIARQEPLRVELQDFLHSIQNGCRPAVDGTAALGILRIALEASGNRYTTLAANMAPV